MLMVFCIRSSVRPAPIWKYVERVSRKLNMPNVLTTRQSSISSFEESDPTTLPLPPPRPNPHPPTNPSTPPPFPPPPPLLPPPFVTDTTHRVFAMATALALSLESFLLVPVGAKIDSLQGMFARKQTTQERVALFLGIFLLIALVLAIK